MLQINPFIPEFLEWIFLSLNLDTTPFEKRGCVKLNNRMANSVDPDKTVRYEPSQLDMQCLQSICIVLQGRKGYTQ